ncbi:cytochrome b [Roseibium aestuarii]|uniref:Cytochrome b n=1 Tax=Roseibium aestuarii TaxID=2600299 RepID=A0ABW4JQ90_9HYPH|nr:cytochrome b [Roseibium aestuarii]
MNRNDDQAGQNAPAPARPEIPGYAAPSRVLHWLVAGLVFLTWPLGLMIGFVRKEVSLDFYMVHESLGFLVLWLMLLRIGARLLTPQPVEFGTPLERMAARAVHLLLYVTLVTSPLSGFLATNAHGFPFSWFGILPVWSPLGKNPDVAWLLSAIHVASAWTMLALLALHLSAVVMHHVIRRDITLLRML